GTGFTLSTFRDLLRSTARFLADLGSRLVGRLEHRRHVLTELPVIRCELGRFIFLRELPHVTRPGFGAVVHCVVGEPRDRRNLFRRLLVTGLLRHSCVLLSRGSAHHAVNEFRHSAPQTGIRSSRKASATAWVLLRTPSFLRIRSM